MAKPWPGHDDSNNKRGPLNWSGRRESNPRPHLGKVLGNAQVDGSCTSTWSSVHEIVHCCHLVIPVVKGSTTTRSAVRLSGCSGRRKTVGAQPSAPQIGERVVRA